MRRTFPAFSVWSAPEVRNRPRAHDGAALKTGMKEGASQSFDRLAQYLRTMA
jgi:hypothetical protein